MGMGWGGLASYMNDCLNARTLSDLTLVEMTSLGVVTLVIRLYEITDLCVCRIGFYFIELKLNVLCEYVLNPNVFRLNVILYKPSTAYAYTSNQHYLTVPRKEMA